MTLYVIITRLDILFNFLIECPDRIIGIKYYVYFWTGFDCVISEGFFFLLFHRLNVWIKVPST